MIHDRYIGVQAVPVPQTGIPYGGGVFYKDILIMGLIFSFHHCWRQGEIGL